MPRERCIIPIVRMLFGEFSWKDVNDVIYCNKIMRLRADVSSLHWQVWQKMLISYNDLASSDYRLLACPGDPINRASLDRAVKLFGHYVKRYIIPARVEVTELGFTELIPNLEFVISHSEAAEDQFFLERYPHTVKCLEEALTNYHEVADALQRPQF